MLIYLLISCKDTNDINFSSINPYYIYIENQLKPSKEKRLFKVKLFEQKNGVKTNNVYFNLHSYTSENSIINFTVNKDESPNFGVNFQPYVDENIKNIGDELIFNYQVYIDNKSIINKIIIIKAEHIYREGEEYRDWALKTLKLDVLDKKYVKKISKENQSILLEYY